MIQVFSYTGVHMLFWWASALALAITPPFQDSFVVGASTAGRPLRVEQVGSGGEVVLILGTIHGNEWSGTSLLHSLIEAVLSQPEWVEDRTLLVVPISNPDGFFLQTRGNANWVDLNRNFPADNYGRSFRQGNEPLSESESQALRILIEDWTPARVISIHEPLSCVDYDGPSAGLAQAIAAAGGLPVQRLGRRSGSLGAWLGTTKNIPVVTIELPYFIHLKHPTVLWERYGDALVQALIYPEEVVDGSLVDGATQE